MKNLQEGFRSKKLKQFARKHGGLDNGKISSDYGNDIFNMTDSDFDDYEIVDYDEHYNRYGIGGWDKNSNLNNDNFKPLYFKDGTFMVKKTPDMKRDEREIGLFSKRDDRSKNKNNDGSKEYQYENPYLNQLINQDNFSKPRGNWGFSGDGNLSKTNLNPRAIKQRHDLNSHGYVGGQYKNIDNRDIVTKANDSRAMKELSENRVNKNIKMSLNDIMIMVNESVKRILKSINEETESPMELVNDEPLKEYEAIGFANKFYTLWHVIERKFSKTFIYRKNISFSKEKAMEKYPDAVFDDNLRGKTHTFTERKGSGESREFFGRSSIPINTVNPGEEVNIDNFVVMGITQGKTRYGGLYQSIVGEDIKDLDRYIINVFSKRDDMPHVGDILSINAKVGFYNENNHSIYLNDANWTFKTNPKDNEEDEIPDGAKIKNEKMMILQHTRGQHAIDGTFRKPGFIVLMNENGTMFYIDTYVRDFRSDFGVQKFKDIIDDLNKGTMLSVSGSIKKVEGFNRIMRAKIQIIQDDEQNGGLFADEPEEEISNEKQYRHVIKIVEYKTQGKSTRAQNANAETKLYNLDIKKYDEFLRFVSELAEKYNAEFKISGYPCNSYDFETVKQLAKEHTYEQRYCDEVTFSINIKETEEIIRYTLRFYFEE